MYEHSPTREEIVEFTCNICGKANSLPMEAFDREAGLCKSCGSTVRYRSLMYLLTKYVLGKPQILKLVHSTKLRGAGLSCSEVYGNYLKKRFQYTNTFFDRRPYLDINNPTDYKDLDFLIASDVFEHTLPPAIRAFEGASRILKEGGILIMTVPYALIEQSIEHYPDCTGYRILDRGKGYKAVELKFQDGSTAVDEEPVWHGGIGNTLEMRIIARNDMMKYLEETSFEVLEEFEYGVPEYGIVSMTGENWGYPVAARKVSKSALKRQAGWLAPLQSAEEGRGHPAALEVRPLEGWHDVEGEGFWWTTKEFSMEVAVPEPAEQFALPFFLPEAVYNSGPVTIWCAIEGKQTCSITCASHGALELQGRFPFKPGFYHMDFIVESRFQLDGDERDLGVCVSVGNGEGEAAEIIPLRVW